MGGAGRGHEWRVRGGRLFPRVAVAPHFNDSYMTGQLGLPDTLMLLLLEEGVLGVIFEGVRYCLAASAQDGLLFIPYAI
jgi:hypothetical protein